MVNGERAALHAPPFREKMSRTRKELLKDLCEQFPPKKAKRRRSGNPLTESTERKLSVEEIVPSPPVEEKKKEEPPKETKEVENGSLLDLNKDKGLRGRIKSKFERKNEREKSSVRSYANQILAFGRRLEEWTRQEPKDFDGVEFLFLLNQVTSLSVSPQLVQTVIVDATIIVNKADREIVVEYAKALVGTGAHFLSVREFQ